VFPIWIYAYLNVLVNVVKSELDSSKNDKRSRWDDLLQNTVYF